MTPYRFIRDGRRLVSEEAEFAIWGSSGPDYEIRFTIGRMDGSILFTFSTTLQKSSEGWDVLITTGRREHTFDEALLGRTRQLIASALPCILTLPLFEEFGPPGSIIRLLAPSDLADHVAYGKRDMPRGEVAEIACHMVES